MTGRKARADRLCVLTVALALALAQYPAHWLQRQPNLPSGASYAFFEFAPASGAGMPAACSTTAPTGAKGETITTTRAQSAWCTNDDYSLTLVPANTARVMRGRPGAPMGILVERTVINSLLHNRDGTQGAWTKTNATCTKTATGPDGVSNSATRCTATAGNATVLQAIVRASTANSTSMYVRRNGGSSGVEVTRDNGTTWNAITASLTSDWKRAVCKDAEGCMGGRCIVIPDLCATSANPTVGFRIVGSGDSIDFDLVQNEAAPELKPTSPITTAGTAVQRDFDSVRVTLRPGMGLLRSWRMGFVGSTQQGNTYAFSPDTGGAPLAGIIANGPLAGGDQYNLWLCYQSGVSLTNPGAPLAAGGTGSQSCTFSTAAITASANGGYATVAGSYTLTGGMTALTLGGNWNGSAGTVSGVVSLVCLDDTGTKCSPTPIFPRGVHIAWIGDSITHGNNSSPVFPPTELYRIYGQHNSKSVQDLAYAGGTVAMMRTTWGQVKDNGWGTLVLLGGVNSLAAGSSAASIWADYEAMLNEALALGMNVVPVTVLPWGHSGGWTAGKQSETVALNALITAWCTANGKTCVDAYTAFGQPGTPEDLAAVYDVGDKIHPNAAGSALLASLVAAANP